MIGLLSTSCTTGPRSGSFARVAIRLLLVTELFIRPFAATAAGDLSVSPTRVDINEAGTGTISVRNAGTEGSLLQVTAMRWLDSPMPDQLQPAPELIAVPPIFALKPGKQQVIRLALRDRTRPTLERSFRLLISEVPAPAAGSAQPTGVRFSLGFNVPVFQKPAGALADPVWTLVSGKTGPTLSVRNDGQAHVQVTSLSVLDVRGKALSDFKDAFYLLPGRSRSWPLSPAVAGTDLTILADTNLGKLEKRLAAPSQ